MSRRMNAMMILSVLIFAFPATALATETPSPQPSSTAAPQVRSLTQTQKDAIAAARTAFAVAKKNATDGFDRAIADAQAIRDQAISEAGSNKGSIRAARMNYAESYKTILNAYRLDISNARIELARALAAARGSNKNR